MVPKESSDVEPEEVPVPEQKVYSLKILKIIKEAQQQHGLRHGDYQRYRGYCSRRIRRLRKVLKVPQGDRRHFKRRDVVAAMVTDDKFLQIPLTMAERAWSYAMQLRQESNTEPRKKFHLVSRLRKAGNHALELQQLIESVECDPRTKLEAQAYVAYIHGSINFELQLWAPAMENFKEAQVVYENLAKALPEHEQLIYKARVEELAPNLRYCAYNIGDTTAIDDLMQMRGKLSRDLLSNLDSLISQNREKQSSTEEITWRGKSCGAGPPEAVAFHMADSRLNGTLEKTEGNQAKVDVLEAHLIDCKDAIEAVHEKLKNRFKNRETDEALWQFYIFKTYLKHIRLSRTLERNLLLVKIAEESEKVKSQNIVRLYEAAIHNLVEMTNLEFQEDFLQEYDAKIKSYSAFRCFYMAKSLSNLHRWREAMALYQRSLQYVKYAMEHKALLSTNLINDLVKLETSIEGAQCIAHAHCVLEEGQEENGDTGKQIKKKTLSEEGDQASVTKPNVGKSTPSMQSIQCKPLFFDLAFNMIEFPDLSDKLPEQNKKGEKGGLTGLVKGLWGWGNK